MGLARICLLPCHIHTCTRSHGGGVFAHGPWFVGHLIFFGVDSTWAWSGLERDLSRDFQDTITCKQAQPPQAHHESVLRNVATCDEDLEEEPCEWNEPPRMCRTHEDASARRCRHGETRV